MATFLAITSRGLGTALESELQSLGMKKLRPIGPNVEFDSSWKDMYRMHLQLRTATRIFLPILDFEAYNAEDLYSAIIKKHDFTKYITPDQTLAVEAHVFEHKELRDGRFVAQKTKDAIVDQFRKKYDRRPDVNADDPDLQIVVRVNRTAISVAIDLTGKPLSFRGYRWVGPIVISSNILAGNFSLASVRQCLYSGRPRKRSGLASVRSTHQPYTTET